MYIHPVCLTLMAVLYVYLIAADLHLHKRVKKLERTVRKLEGTNGNDKPKTPRWEGKEDLN